MPREIECLLNDNHQKGKMMIMIMKTSGSQVDSPSREIEKFDIKQPPKGEKDDYDSKNSWISDGLSNGHSRFFLRGVRNISYSKLFSE